MDKQQQENLKKEKSDLLDIEIIQLEKEREYIMSREEAKLAEIDKKLEELKVQKDIFIQFNAK